MAKGGVGKGDAEFIDDFRKVMGVGAGEQMFEFSSFNAVEFVAGIAHGFFQEPDRQWMAVGVTRFLRDMDAAGDGEHSTLCCGCFKKLRTVPSRVCVGRSVGGVVAFGACEVCAPDRVAMDRLAEKFISNFMDVRRSFVISDDVVGHG